MAAFRADQILSDVVAITEFAYVDQLINEYVATILANHTYHALLDLSVHNLSIIS